MERLIVFIAGAALCMASAAQQFRWTGKDGTVEYGDTPPPGVKATRLKPPPPPPSVPAAKDKELSPEAAFQKRQQERKEKEDKAEKERVAAEERRQNCEEARSALRALESGQRVMTVNAAGERVFMDDEQRRREIERARKAVSGWCGG